MIKNTLLALSFISLLTFTGCGDEAKASSIENMTEVATGKSTTALINLDKVVDFKNMSKAEKEYVTWEGYSEELYDNVYNKKGITYKELPFVWVFIDNTKHKFSKDLWLHLDTVTEYILGFRNNKSYKKHNLKEFEEYTKTI